MFSPLSGAHCPPPTLCPECFWRTFPPPKNKEGSIFSRSGRKQQKENPHQSALRPVFHRYILLWGELRAQVRGGKDALSRTGVQACWTEATSSWLNVWLTSKTFYQKVSIIVSELREDFFISAASFIKKRASITLQWTLQFITKISWYEWSLSPNALVLLWEGDMTARTDIGIHHCPQSSFLSILCLKYFIQKLQATLEMNLIQALNVGNELYSWEKKKKEQLRQAGGPVQIITVHLQR